MGLDAVEIVMAVEEAFDIRIEDAEAGKLLTPRQLIDLVQSKVSVITASVCLTQRAFNLLRKSLLRHGGWKRSEITPATNLAALIGRDQRTSLLGKISAEMGIKNPPKLVRANWLNITLLTSSLITGIWVAWAARHTFGSILVWIFISVAILTAGVALRLTKPLCKEFPANLKTVGDLSRWVMTHKVDLANAAIPGWTREQIVVRVREIIIEQLGCKPDFSEDANFVKDLGLS
jgi:acyl carrier protein